MGVGLRNQRIVQLNRLLVLPLTAIDRSQGKLRQGREAVVMGGGYGFEFARGPGVVAQIRVRDPRKITGMVGGASVRILVNNRLSQVYALLRRPFLRTKRRSGIPVSRGGGVPAGRKGVSKTRTA